LGIKKFNPHSSNKSRVSVVAITTSPIEPDRPFRKNEAVRERKKSKQL